MVLVLGMVLPGIGVQAASDRPASALPDLVETELQVGIREARAVAADFRTAVREAADLVVPDLLLQPEAFEGLERVGSVPFFLSPAASLLVPIVVQRLPPGSYG